MHTHTHTYGANRPRESFTVVPTSCRASGQELMHPAAHQQRTDRVTRCRGGRFQQYESVARGDPFTLIQSLTGHDFFLIVIRGQRIEGEFVSPIFNMSPIRQDMHFWQTDKQILTTRYDVYGPAELKVLGDLIW